MKRFVRKWRYPLFRAVMLTAWALAAGFPIFWITSTSFKPDFEWHKWPPVYISKNSTLDNYRMVWPIQQTSSIFVTPDQKGHGVAHESVAANKPWHALKNSLFIALSATAIAVAFGTLLAYGVSRYRILSDARMFQLLVLRMIPPIVVAAPITLYYSALNLMDTASGLIIVYFITSLPYAVWMTKSFIDEVPREMEQAAEILGASRWQTIREIIFPLIRSGVVATFLFILILTWSEYLLSFILSKVDVVTLPVQLSKYEGSTEGRVYGHQAALAVGITFPLIVIGIFIRKHLVRGFTFGMVKR
jgi:multiple sugar transport system permease protein